MRIAPVVEIKAKFSAYLEESKNGPIVVTKNGKPVAVLLAIGDEEELERLILAHSPKFQAIMARGKEEIRRGEGIEHEEFWGDVEAEDRGLHA
jgi:prevent-host-death family protein